MARYYGLSAKQIAHMMREIDDFITNVLSDETLTPYFDCLSEAWANTVESAESDEDLKHLVRYIVMELASKNYLFETHAALNTAGKGRSIYKQVLRLGSVDTPWVGGPQANEAIDAHLKNYPKPTFEQYNALDDCYDHCFVKSYGIVCDRASLKELRPFLNEVLADFKNNDECVKMGYGIISTVNNNTLYGIVLRASDKAVQTLDKALKTAFQAEGYHVINTQGKPIRKTQSKRPKTPKRCQKSHRLC